MRLYIRFVMFINGLIAAVLGAGLILCAYPLPGFVPYRDLGGLLQIPGSQPYWALGGTMLLILNAIALTRRFFGAYRAKEIHLLEGGGRVQVKTAAIEELLGRIAKSNPLVIDAKVRVFSLFFRRYRIMAGLALVDSPELHRAIEQVRGRLRERFLDVFPEASHVDVDVNVTGVLHDGQRAAVFEDAYQGPQYPVGDEVPFPTRRPLRKK